MYDYSKLFGRIAEKCGTRKEFSSAIGISSTSLTNKLHQRTCFTQADIAKACEILSIETEEIPAYFFAEAVAKV